jgi:hypothetical protein
MLPRPRGGAAGRRRAAARRRPGPAARTLAPGRANKKNYFILDRKKIIFGNLPV